MRLILAVLAVLGLMLSPLAATAAARECLAHDHAMAAMADCPEMAAMAKGAASHDSGDPHGKPAEHDRDSCAQACAALASVAAATVAPDVTIAPVLAHAVLEPASVLPIHGRAPPGLERPPRMIA